MAHTTVAIRAVQQLPITKARINLGAVVKQVRLNNEYVVLEKGGIPVAAVVPIDEFDDYPDLQDPAMRTHIRKSNAEYMARKSHPTEEFLAEIIQSTERKPRRPRTIGVGIIS